MTPTGATQPKILLFGDYPEQIDLASQTPFSGSPGHMLDGLIQESGMNPADCMKSVVSESSPPLKKGKPDFSAWLCHTKSPKHPTWKQWKKSWVCPSLWDDFLRALALIELAKPNVIIALGPLALFFLSAEISTKKWRGSQLVHRGSSWTCQVIPTYSPRAIQRDWSIRASVVCDFRRAVRVNGVAVTPPAKWNFITRPSFAVACEVLGKLKSMVEVAPTPLSIDIETRAGHIACIGFAWSSADAICIPFMCVDRPDGYWSATEELVLSNLMRDIMEHPNAECFGQNFLYDTQYIYRFLFCLPNTAYDTMIAQHILYPGTPKGLDYLASLYCEHYVYWKESHKVDITHKQED